MKDDKHDELEAAATAAMQELDELMDGTPPFILPSQMLQLLASQYGELIRRFWMMRNAGEICTIVGDHQEAKQQFDAAKNSWKRIQALREVAEQHGVAEDFAKIVAEYEAQEKEKVDKMRAAAKLRAAKGNKHDALDALAAH
jgi:hypothetical protein